MPWLSFGEVSVRDVVLMSKYRSLGTRDGPGNDLGIKRVGDAVTWRYGARLKEIKVASTTNVFISNL